MVAILLIAGGIFLFKKIFKEKNSFAKEDLVEKNLARQWEQKEKDWNYKFDEWRGWLKERKLDPSIAPITTKNIAKTALQVKATIAQRARLDERIQQMETTCQEARERICSLEPLVKKRFLE